ncbi:MAG TPA: PPC domain-containing protein [Opitutaceae bacterium]|nr:PPC domain-containing protein [Opitutaceae bacterium]
MKINFSVLRAGVCLFLMVALAHAQNAQRPPPHLALVYPAGGQRGTTFAVSLGGQNLADASAVYFSGAGVTAKVVGYERPLTQKEINDLREKLQQLQERRAAARGLPPPVPPAGAEKKKAPVAASPAASPAPPPEFTDDDERQLAEIRQTLATRVNRQASSALAETVTLQITLAPDAATGERELRVRTPLGLSNPFVFRIDTLPEFTRPVVTSTNSPALQPGRSTDPRERRFPPREMTLTPPAIANGQILPGETNRLRFAAKKGQHITAVVAARALIPYLADAVPGWFQPTLALFDARGRELAYDDDYRFNPDPALSVTIPADGAYVVEIKDAIYRGREDFVYRVAVGELPLPSTAFPRPPAPAAFEIEPNDRIENATSIAPPAFVDGCIEHRDDVDVFRFDGKAGAIVVAEISARRLGSPLDSTLTLIDATGRQLAFNDDFDDKAAALITHQADSRISITLPADGTYFVRVADAQHQGGADFAYRLRLGAPQPDFELRVVPATLNLRAGAATPVTVYALRRDGFVGEIALALRNAPRGLMLSGARIPRNQDKIQLTVTAPLLMPDTPFDLEFAGLAVIDGRTVTHTATPAEDMMQAFAYHHLVPAHELLALVAGRGAAFWIVDRVPLKIVAGTPSRLRIAVPSARFIGKVQFELTDPPDGITATSTTAGDGFVDVAITCDSAKIKPGLQGNLLLNASGERTNPNAANAAARTQRIPLGFVPAIPFEVVVASQQPST